VIKKEEEVKNPEKMIKGSKKKWSTELLGLGKTNVGGGKNVNGCWSNV
jgi:hypothetical protein